MRPEVCEVWTGGELAGLVLGTVGLATAGVLAIILLCVRLAARPWPLQQAAEPEATEEAAEEAATATTTASSAPPGRRHHARRRRDRAQHGVRGAVIGVSAVAGLGIGEGDRRAS
jgi:predicted lipid-binding transport protein (Tim44 family)